MDFSKEIDPMLVLKSNEGILNLIMKKVRSTSLADEIDITLLGLYNNLIQTTKESFILVKNQNTESIGAILRSQSEIFITLMYIFNNENPEDTAKYFFNWSKFKNIQIAKIITKWKDKKLDESTYSKAEREFKKKCIEYIDKHKNVKSFNIYSSNNWLGFDYKTSSIRKIFQFVGYEKYYFILYSPMSSMSHGSGVVENIVKKGERRIEFKSMIQTETMLTFQLEFLEDVRRKMIDYYDIVYIEEI